MNKGLQLEECSTDMVREGRVSVGHTHPLISIGTKERALLVYMFNNKKKRFNIKAYSRVSNIKRSTIYYMLNKLTESGLVSKPYHANYEITNKGVTAIGVSDKGVSSARKECRGGVRNLSTHFLRYVVPIVDRSGFCEGRICELNPVDWRKLSLQNNFQFYIYFDDATVIVTTRKVLIRVHDVVSEDTDECQFETFNKALGYVKGLRKIGLVGEQISLEPSHYARVDSIFGDLLSKVDERYFVDLGDGKKFWIDNSSGPVEDEVNDVLARERIDNMLRAVSCNDIDFGDIGSIKEVLGVIAKIESFKMIRSSNLLNKDLEDKKGVSPDYVG